MAFNGKAIVRLGYLKPQVRVLAAHSPNALALDDMVSPWLTNTRLQTRSGGCRLVPILT